MFPRTLCAEICAQTDYNDDQDDVEEAGEEN